MVFAECGSILNTCVLALTASLASIITAFMAYVKAHATEKKANGNN